MTYTCNKHGVPNLTDSCPACMEEYQHNRPASEMTCAERAQALREINPQLTIPFDLLHKRIEELVGRPVWTHEMGTEGFKALIAETESDRVDPSNMLVALPMDKPVILVIPE